LEEVDPMQASKREDGAASNATRVRRMGMKNLWVVFLAVLVVAAGCSLSSDDDDDLTGDLDGYVFVTTGAARSIQVRGLREDIEDETSDPLEGVKVTIDGKDGISDTNGYFEITSIQPGTYAVCFSCACFEDLVVSGVAISQGQTTHLSYQNLKFAPKTWNFLVYLDGDNDLEHYAIMDLNEMEQVGSTKDVNILVLIDRIEGEDTSNGDWTGTRLYYINQDTNASTIGSTLLADLGERDMSYPDTLRDFIIYCQEHFPAGRTCLTLWNHGGGVYPKAVAMSRPVIGETPQTRRATGGGRGICWDETTGLTAWDCLTTDEVASAFSAARAETGQKIDIINMDACLTQMLEVAYEWRNETDFIVGSEEEVSQYGNDYATILNHLTGYPSVSADAFARILVDDYYAYYYASGYDTTYSRIDLGSPFNALINSFADFAHALNVSSDIPATYLAWWYTTIFFGYWENIDLYDFADDLTVLSDDAAVVSAGNSLKTAISNAAYCRNTGIYDGAAYGVAVLLPSNNEWPWYSGSNQYVTLALSTDTEWDEFISDFVAFTANPLSSAETLTASVTWPWGDIDLNVWDTDGYYYPYQGASPNGVFNHDFTNGGTETWTLNQPHVPGYFEVLVDTYNYAGNVACSINKNGTVYSATISVSSWNYYWLYVDLVKQQVKFKAVKAENLRLNKDKKY
jgi:hypothetical protein